MNALVNWVPDLNYLPDTMDRFFQAFRTPVADWTPRADIFETENELALEFDLPGIQQKDLEIVVEKGALVLKGERKAPANMEQYRRVERNYGSFTRVFTLPEVVDAEKISANLSNGVLTLRLPKREEVKPRQIQVKVA